MPDASREPTSSTAAAWQYRRQLGNTQVTTPFWTKWEPCSREEFNRLLADPDAEVRELGVIEARAPQPSDISAAEQIAADYIYKYERDDGICAYRPSDAARAWTVDAVWGLLAEPDFAVAMAARAPEPVSDERIDKLADEHLNTARIEGLLECDYTPRIRAFARALLKGKP